MDQLETTLKRVDSAVKQNPGFKVVYEFPDKKAALRARDALKEMKMNHIVEIRVRGN